MNIFRILLLAGGAFGVVLLLPGTMMRSGTIWVVRSLMKIRALRLRVRQDSPSASRTDDAVNAHLQSVGGSR